MSDEQPNPTDHLLAMIREASALADELGLTSVGIDLNCALINMGEEGSVPRKRDAA